MPVTDDNLLSMGFYYHDGGHVFVNLAIFRDDHFYYYDLAGNRVVLKHMQEVADLIFGVTPFLDMTADA